MVVDYIVPFNASQKIGFKEPLVIAIVHHCVSVKAFNYSLSILRLFLVVTKEVFIRVWNLHVCCITECVPSTFVCSLVVVNCAAVSNHVYICVDVI